MITALLLFLRTKKRLAIEYGMIAAVVTLAGTTLALWSQKGKQARQLQATEQRVTVLELVQEQNVATIEDLKRLRHNDARALDGLLTDFKELSARDTQVRQRLRILEQSNEAIRDYLDTPIPLELRCLLDATCYPGNGPGNQDRASVTAQEPARAVLRTTTAPLAGNARPR